MMRSLFSGVSGLVSHQVAMDVEGNNIANVNTVGFKYSRTNFQDSLLQTMKTSTAPQGKLGGKNALQIGSGVGVATVQRIHSQGPTQQTDKNTDMAINGNGYFIVSDDGGKSYYYTRAGNFTFDANGNLVNPNGLIIQGWIADSKFNVDSSMGIANISIDPAMTVPALPTSEVKISANLNADITIGTSERAPASGTINLNSDVGALYSYNGEQLSLKRNLDVITLELSRRFDVGGVMTESSAVYSFTYGAGTTDTDGYFVTMQDLLNEINARIKDSTGVYDNKVLLTGDGQIAAAQHVSAVLDSMSTNAVLNDILETITYGSFMSRSFKSSVNAYTGADYAGELFNDEGQAFMLENGQGLAFSVENLGETRKFVYQEPNIKNNNAYLLNNFQSALDITKATKEQGLHWTLNSNGEKASLNVGDTITFTFDPVNLGAVIQPITLTYGIAGLNGFQTLEELCEQINNQIVLSGTSGTTRVITWDADNGVLVDGSDVITAATIALAGGGAPAANTPQARLQAMMDVFAATGSSEQFKKNDVYYFTDIQELVNLYQDALDDASDPLNFDKPLMATAYLNEYGQLTVANNGTATFEMNVTGYNAFPRVGEEEMGASSGNLLFTQSFAKGGKVGTQTAMPSGSVYAAAYRTGVEVYDSSGAKHQLVINYRKVETSSGNDTRTRWKWYVDAAEPTTFEYPTYGEIVFNLDGSVQSYTPPSVTINPRTGSASGQIIRIDFGTGGSFDRLTSFAETSSVRNGTGGNGYAGGFLEEITVNANGVLVGKFSNGLQFDLGQVAIATFVNDEGLEAQGGNLYTQAPNSGPSTVGTAGTANRGIIQPSYLEMSNVDLSKSLTNLIIIQRGYQASSKTITTSDQLLNTLLQLKQ
ncbi:MAG: flagellar hook-basal body complex protein [Helicobacteraceae bacterium]|jgi:flagellar hook protein FlgE|nr:flagellar hook-basal body complex protein [Helicobacteraceae bacterium]